MEKSRHGKRIGISLFEGVIGIIVILVMTVMAVPQIGGAREDYRLRAVGGEVAGSASNARILAITENSDFRLTVVDADTYAIREDINGTWTADTRYDRPSNFSIAAVNTNETADFHSRGNAASVTPFAITNPNGTTRDVVVELSGRVYAQ